MHSNRRVVLFFAWASFCLLACVKTEVVGASDVNVDCPGPDEAFVTTCSGSESSGTNDETLPEDKVFDESDLVNEVLEDSKEKESPSGNKYNSGGTSANKDDRFQDINSEKDENGFCDADEGAAAIQQIKQTTKKLIQKYYDPLPKQGKACIGTICGFTASRLSLGVANRIFRLAGASWVLSEALHTTGFCDEAKCVPEEARPWVGILRRALIKQCIRVRMIARRIWNQDKIREIVKRDEIVAAGFAAGAFVGFVI